MLKNTGGKTMFKTYYTPKHLKYPQSVHKIKHNVKHYLIWYLHLSGNFF